MCYNAFVQDWHFAVNQVGGSMNFIERLTQLSQSATDVDSLPDKQLASDVLKLVSDTYGKKWNDPTSLQSGVSPEMLEACFSSILGMTLMTQIIERLPVLVEQFRGNDNYLCLSLVWESELLGEIAKQSARGTPVTKNVYELSFLIFNLLGPLYVGRFVDQTTKRIATVH